MIRYYCWLYSCCLLLGGCTRDGMTATTATYVRIEVVEYKTNLPVQSATVTLYHCTDYDLVFGCQRKGVLGVVYTDNKGIASVNESDYSKANEGIIITKAGYWQQNANAGLYELNAQAPVLMRLKQAQSYPPKSRLTVFVADERARVNTVLVQSIFLKDTTLNITAFGGQLNTISWKISDSTTFTMLGQGALPAVVFDKNGNNNITVTY